MHIGRQVKYSLQILMKTQFSRQFSKKYSNIEYYENPFGGSRVVPPVGRMDTTTDMTKLRFTFHNFARASKKQQKNL